MTLIDHEKEKSTKSEKAKKSYYKNIKLANLLFHGNKYAYMC